MPGAHGAANILMAAIRVFQENRDFIVGTLIHILPTLGFCFAFAVASLRLEGKDLKKNAS